MSKKEECPVLGLYLGNTYSCVGVWQKGHVKIIPGEHGEKYIPSYVSFTDTDILIGHAAKNLLDANPSNTIFNFGSLFGRRYSDPCVQEDIKRWPFKVAGSPNDMPMIVVNQKGEEKKYAVEEISAMVICKLREMAEAYVGSTVKNAVLAVPPNFEDSQCEAFKNAATIAGLNVMWAISEPMAACTAYEIDKKSLDIHREINVLVFDLEGATFDVSVIRIVEGIDDIKSTVGDSHFGSQAFDKRMVNYLVEEFKLTNNIDISENPKAMRRLSLACERAKVRLSSTDQATIEIDSLTEGIDFTTTITRKKFEELCIDLFGKCIEEVEKALKAARLRKRLIHEIVLVGEASQIPKVKQLLQDFFHGKEPRDSLNPREVVARGAAVLAASFNEDREDCILGSYECIRFSVGLETVGDVMTTFIPVWTTVPTKREKVFSTYADNQTSVMLNVYEGLRVKSKDNYLLGKLELTGLPPSPRGVLQIKVCFEVIHDYNLVVSAEEKTTGIKNQITLIPLEKEIGTTQQEKLRGEADRYELEDQEFKFNEVTNDIRNSMKDEKVWSKLSADEMNEIEDAINEARLGLSKNGSARELDFDGEMQQLEDIYNSIILKAGPEMNNGGIYNRQHLLKDC